MTRPAPAARRLAATACCGALLALAAAGAGAQKVYRCGADGRTYQDEPCRGGHAVDVSDPRSAGQRRAAWQAVADDARLAAQLEQDRLARERLERGRIARETAAYARAERAAAAASAGEDRRPARAVRRVRDGTPAPPTYRVPVRER